MELKWFPDNESEETVNGVTATDALTVTERLCRLVGRQKVEDIFRDYKRLKSLPEINEDIPHQRYQPYHALHKVSEIFKELERKGFSDERERLNITKVVKDFYIENPAYQAALLLRKQPGWNPEYADDYLIDRLWALVKGIPRADFKKTFDAMYSDEVTTTCMYENGVLVSKDELNRRTEALDKEERKGWITFLRKVLYMRNTPYAILASVPPNSLARGLRGSCATPASTMDFQDLEFDKECLVASALEIGEVKKNRKTKKDPRNVRA